MRLAIILTLVALTTGCSAFNGKVNHRYVDRCVNCMTYTYGNGPSDTVTQTMWR